MPPEPHPVHYRPRAETCIWIAERRWCSAFHLPPPANRREPTPGNPASLRIPERASFSRLGESSRIWSISANNLRTSHGNQTTVTGSLLILKECLLSIAAIAGIVAIKHVVPFLDHKLLRKIRLPLHRAGFDRQQLDCLPKSNRQSTFRPYLAPTLSSLPLPECRGRFGGLDFMRNVKLLIPAFTLAALSGLTLAAQQQPGQPAPGMPQPSQTQPGSQPGTAPQPGSMPEQQTSPSQQGAAVPTPSTANAPEANNAELRP